jgi:hypothetical protein
MSFAAAEGAKHTAPKPASKRIPTRKLREFDNFCSIERDLMITPVHWPDFVNSRLKIDYGVSKKHLASGSRPKPLSTQLKRACKIQKNKFYARSHFLLRYHFPSKVAINFRRRDARGCKVGVQGKMAVSTQSRKAERAATQNPAETLESPSPREACLSVRLWSAPSDSDSGPAPSLWENDNPAACLTLDLIAASGGLPTARREEVLVASFSTFQSAAITARRLQWAVQGFTESEEPQATSLALLIHSADEGAAESVAEDAFHSLSQASSGTILLTEKASQPFDRQPGFPLQVAAGDGLWELAWSRPEDHFSRSEDDEFLTRIAAEQGVQEAAPEQPVPQPANEAVAEEYRTGSHRTGSYRQPSVDEPPQKSWIKIGGLALAAVVVLVIAVYFFSGKSNPAPATNQTAKESSAQPKHAAAQEPASTAKTPKNASKPEAQQAQETQPEKPRQVEPPAPKPSRENNGRCDLDSSQYGGLIAQAEKNRGRGKYADAIRQFTAVLACDPGNAKAREGLESARAASIE